jgi:acyl carrier protein
MLLSALKVMTRRAPVVAPRMVATAPNRFFMNNLGLSEHDLVPAGQKFEGGHVELWKDQHKKTETALALKTNDEVEEYVLSLVRGYFRTTKKAALNLESTFADHGLDSLDSIELIIQVEDELGYVIDAENLEKFTKPKHFVNFINHFEAYKREFHKLPHEGIHAEFNPDESFPGAGPVFRLFMGKKK